MSNAPAIRLRSRWAKGGLIFGLWTFIGLAFSSQFYLSRVNTSPVTWRFALEHSLADWYLFALLSAPALALARRFHFERDQWARPLTVHLLAGAAFSLLWMVVRAWVEEWFSRGGDNAVSFRTAFGYALAATFFFNLLIYWGIVSVSYSMEYYQRYQERELRTAELEATLAQARLQALQMQLNPHFLFNTLHSISSLMHKDIEAADEMIARFGDLLRLALENTETHEVPLREELEFLRSYLEIEQIRFGERLNVRLDIDPETLEARVPNLILQPLVENAVQHGIEPHARPGHIELRARRAEEKLLLQVRDNGDGLSAGAQREGVGMSNTRARLQQLYGGDHRFELQNEQKGGLLVSVTIPFRASATMEKRNSAKDKL
jgi:two-component sensor histidine kinase